MSFENVPDEQIAKEISARVAELKSRHAKRQKELEERHRQTMQNAFAAEQAKKPGRKPKEKTNAVAA